MVGQWPGVRVYHGQEGQDGDVAVLRKSGGFGSEAGTGAGRMAVFPIFPLSPRKRTAHPDERTSRNLSSPGRHSVRRLPPKRLLENAPGKRPGAGVSVEGGFATYR